jgi:hypothetical protein
MRSGAEVDLPGLCAPYWFTTCAHQVKRAHRAKRALVYNLGGVGRETGGRDAGRGSGKDREKRGKRQTMGGGGKYGKKGERENGGREGGGVEARRKGRGGVRAPGVKCRACTQRDLRRSLTNRATRAVFLSACGLLVDVRGPVSWNTCKHWPFLVTCACCSYRIVVGQWPEGRVLACPCGRQWSNVQLSINFLGHDNPPPNQP